MEPPSPTAQERFAALTEGAAAAQQTIAETFGRFGEAMTAVMLKTAEEWPPGRILASVLTEYNRRMDQFNGRGAPDGPA